MAEIRRVSPDEMIASAKRIESEIMQWRECSNKIYALVNELDAMWDGDANDAFNRQWEEDRPKYQALFELMLMYKSAIEQAAALYSAREQEVTNIINSGKKSDFPLGTFHDASFIKDYIVISEPERRDLWVNIFKDGDFWKQN